MLDNVYRAQFGCKGEVIKHTHARARALQTTAVRRPRGHARAKYEGAVGRGEEGFCFVSFSRAGLHLVDRWQHHRVRRHGLQLLRLEVRHADRSREVLGHGQLQAAVRGLNVRQALAALLVLPSRVEAPAIALPGSPGLRVDKACGKARAWGALLKFKKMRGRVVTLCTHRASLAPAPHSCARLGECRKTGKNRAREGGVIHGPGPWMITRST